MTTSHGGRRAAWPHASLWLVAVAVAGATAVAVLVSTQAGAYALAAVLACGAVARALLGGRRPEAFAVRSRWFDVALLIALAAAIAVLAAVLPPG